MGRNGHCPLPLAHLEYDWKTRCRIYVLSTKKSKFQTRDKEGQGQSEGTCPMITFVGSSFLPQPIISACTCGRQHLTARPPRKPARLSTLVVTVSVQVEPPAFLVCMKQRGSWAAGLCFIERVFWDFGLNLLKLEYPISWANQM